MLTPWSSLMLSLSLWANKLYLKCSCRTCVVGIPVCCLFPGGRARRLFWASSLWKVVFSSVIITISIYRPQYFTWGTSYYDGSIMHVICSHVLFTLFLASYMRHMMCMHFIYQGNITNYNTVDLALHFHGSLYMDLVFTYPWVCGKRLMVPRAHFERILHTMILSVEGL